MYSSSVYYMYQTRLNLNLMHVEFLLCIMATSKCVRWCNTRYIQSWLCVRITLILDVFCWCNRKLVLCTNSEHVQYSWVPTSPSNMYIIRDAMPAHYNYDPKSNWINIIKNVIEYCQSPRKTDVSIVNIEWPYLYCREPCHVKHSVHVALAFQIHRELKKHWSMSHSRPLYLLVPVHQAE